MYNVIKFQVNVRGRKRNKFKLNISPVSSSESYFVHEPSNIKDLLIMAITKCVL